MDDNRKDNNQKIVEFKNEVISLVNDVTSGKYATQAGWAFNKEYFDKVQELLNRYIPDWYEKIKIHTDSEDVKLLEVYKKRIIIVSICSEYFTIKVFSPFNIGGVDKLVYNLSLANIK